MCMELPCKRLIVEDTGSARARAGNRPSRHTAALHLHETLGRRAHDRDTVEARQRRERGGIRFAKPPIEIVRFDTLSHLPTPRAGQIRLIDIARGDVLERALHSVDETLGRFLYDVSFDEFAE